MLCSPEEKKGKKNNNNDIQFHQLLLLWNRNEKKKMNIKQLCIFYHVSSVSCCEALFAFHLIKRTHLYVKHTHLSMVFGDENKNVWEKDN